MKQGKLIILSGPSGAGKGSIKEKLLADPEIPLYFSISCTTRKPRPGEIDGVHYHFIDQKTFDALVAEDGFLEYANFVDHSYGTPKKEVFQKMREGKHVLLEIETKGARQVMARVPDTLSIFIMPPSMTELERRIRFRNTESEDEIQSRLKQAQEDMDNSRYYDHIIINDDLDQAAAAVKALIMA